MNEIWIRPITRAEQRYRTDGDWLLDQRLDVGETRANRIIDEIRVTDMGNDKHTAILAAHEFVEMLLCRFRGITQAQADAFDMAHEDPENAGDDPRACYHAEHTFATAIERLLAEALGVDWGDYNAAYDRLPAWPQS